MCIVENEFLQLMNKNVILRDRCISDIEDYITWNTKETEWQNWDAPWEKDELFDINEMRKNMLEGLKKPLPKMRKRFEICYKDGSHIGWMNSYYIDGDRNKMAIGIDIPCKSYRGKNLGEQAFSKFIAYLLKSEDIKDIYTQTWSGNERMIRLAKKCCFSEVEREIDYRDINGKKYDGLTFKLNKSNFIKKYSCIM